MLSTGAQAAESLATERLEPLGLSRRAWEVLSALAESGPRTQIKLATALSIDRTAMVYLLDELEEKKLVERVRNPDDRRSFLVHLTPKGEKRQRKAANELAAQTEVLLEPLEAAERRRLVDLLTRLADHWEQLSTTRP